jgi:hypothetical protein
VKVVTRLQIEFEIEIEESSAYQHPLKSKSILASIRNTMSLFRLQRQRQLLTSIATALLLCSVAQDVDAASGVALDASSDASSSSSSSHSSSRSNSSNHHRRLNNQRIDCPTGVGYCDNPFDILVDPTVACDEETCAWLVTLLDPVSKPVICRSIQLVGDVPDFLEPCYWWEALYGGPTPTLAPSASAEPTAAPSSGTSLSSLPLLFSLLPLSLSHYDTSNTHYDTHHNTHTFQQHSSL